MEISSRHTEVHSDFELENQPVFNVVIVYEDFATGKHAKETYDYLVHQLGSEYEFKNQMWKFEVLSNPKMLEMAVKDATDADLIIIATHGAGDLPLEVKSWIDQWTSQKSRARGLAVLVNRSDEEGGVDYSAINSYLETIARQADMDFFAQPDSWPERNDEISVQGILERPERATTVMENFLQHPMPTAVNPALFAPRIPASHWGINE